jgi:hypothetical protein
MSYFELTVAITIGTISGSYVVQMGKAVGADFTVLLALLA